jgi:hypothetical protein
LEVWVLGGAEEGEGIPEARHVGNGPWETWSVGVLPVPGPKERRAHPVPVPATNPARGVVRPVY